jgi:hypothetical protein
MMSEEFEFFSTDFNNWNFNNMINKPGLDPFNNNKKLDQFGERDREPAFPRQISQKPVFVTFQSI